MPSYEIFELSQWQSLEGRLSTNSELDAMRWTVNLTAAGRKVKVFRDGKEVKLTFTEVETGCPAAPVDTGCPVNGG